MSVYELLNVIRDFLKRKKTMSNEDDFYEPLPRLAQYISGHI